jgi:translation initiation factor 4E
MADEIDTRPASAGSRGRPAHATEDDDREEGEIAADAPSPALPAAHPLEHSWTFWFDNPHGKNKMAAWGSSIRPIHTFSTVEDFWGCVRLSLSDTCTPLNLLSLLSQLSYLSL